MEPAGGFEHSICRLQIGRPTFELHRPNRHMTSGRNSHSVVQEELPSPQLCAAAHPVSLGIDAIPRGCSRQSLSPRFAVTFASCLLRDALPAALNGVSTF